MQILIVVLMMVTIAVSYASIFEWILHKYVMHNKPFGFRYAYNAHTKVHHGDFKAGKTYHLQPGIDSKKITMAWWNGPVLVAISSIPFWLIGWMIGDWVIPITASVTIACYYGAYEYLHWCMHLPKSRGVEKSYLFQWINGHHVLHHRYKNKNLNVVLPLADWFFGTLLLLSSKPFEQVRGRSVPDVQPKKYTT